MTNLTNPAEVDRLANMIENLIEEARRHAVAQVNHTMVRAYYEIGRMIVENEQGGEARAKYGKGLLKELSGRLTQRFGKGFSVENLDRMRFFYRVYREKSSTVLTILEEGKTDASSRTSGCAPATTNGIFSLSWSHYLFLMRIDNADERRFYEIESERNHWSLRELRRQFDSALYERLALSSDKKKLTDLARKGQIIEKPSDAVKDPYVLEFLGWPEKAEYSESDLESRIINHLQDFLMEMGKGFTFVGRQVRFTFDEEHFKVDN